jgi:TetR/AcrR family transcriptional regulator, fatty acid metabolism regulator protein
MNTLHNSVMPEDSTHTSRNRLLAAGKALFSRLGYEQASTAAIARDAGTSESQLIRYFGGKSGLLEAIFNEAWAALNDDITRHLEESAHGREAILRILGLVMEGFSRDHQMAFLFMFEGRRVRGHDVALSKGFLKFYELLHDLVRRGQSDGSFRNDITSDVLASALLGAAEGMMRDRMIGERIGQPRQYDDAAIQRTFEGIVNGLAATPQK